MQSRFFLASSLLGLVGCANQTTGPIEVFNEVFIESGCCGCSDAPSPCDDDDDDGGDGGGDDGGDDGSGDDGGGTTTTPAEVDLDGAVRPAAAQETLSYHAGARRGPKSSVPRPRTIS